MEIIANKRILPSMGTMYKNIWLTVGRTLPIFLPLPKHIGTNRTSDYLVEKRATCNAAQN